MERSITGGCLLEVQFDVLDRGLEDLQTRARSEQMHKMRAMHAFLSRRGNTLEH